MAGFRLFSLGDIPIFVSPFYLLLLFLFGSRHPDPKIGLLFALTATVSLLVHELGHALMARRFRLQPSILLHGFGGLTSHHQAERDRDDALIVAAGPAAGLTLGALAIAAAYALPRLAPDLAHGYGMQFLEQLVFVNIFWSILNLLPIWPLDGGQLTRLGMLRLLKPNVAEKVVHGLSVALLIAAAAWAFSAQQIFIGIIALMFIYNNVQVLRGEQSSGPIRRRNTHGKALLKDAEAAFAAGDFAEAARVAHQLRAESTIPTDKMPTLWTILGVSEVRLGRHQSAMSFLSRAPAEKREVIEAKIEALHMLDEDEALDALLESPEFARLPSSRRLEILRVVRPGWVEGG